MDWATLAALLAPLRVVAAPPEYSHGPGAIVLERTGGRRELARVNAWHIYDEWQVTGIFRDRESDDALDAFLAQVWGAIRAVAAPNTFESEYSPPESGNLRNAIIRFTTIRLERM